MIAENLQVIKHKDVRIRHHERLTTFSLLSCHGAVKNSLDIHSLPWGTRCDNIKQWLCKVPLFSCGTLPQLSRPRHSVAFVFASVAVFVQPRWFRGKHYRQRRCITACKCTNSFERYCIKIRPPPPWIFLHSELQILYFHDQKVMKIKQGKKINFTMNKDIY